MKKQVGFTLIELMVVVAIFLIVGVGIFWFLAVKTLAQGNFWCDDAKLLACVQQIDQDAVEVTWVERHVFDLTTVNVKLADKRSVAEYYADTNILQNCTAFSDPDAETRSPIRPLESIHVGDGQGTRFAP